MTIEGILVGLLAIGAGAAWAFFGLRFFAILLPIWAFFFGLTSGIDFASTIFADGIIGTTLSWGVGLVFGIVLALISYFWYYAAVVIAVGALGYMLGAGLVAVVFTSTPGSCSSSPASSLGAVFAVGAFVLAVPAVLVIVVSAISGALAIVNGALILFGLDQGRGPRRRRLRRPSLNYGLVGSIAAIVIAVAAVFFQMRDVARTGAAMVSQSDYRY